jgi:TorA maturation chaperone TorD
MELFRALAVLAEAPRAETAGVASALGLGRTPTADEFTAAFVLELPPVASVYVGAEGMLGGEARSRVAGFLTALGLAPPPEPDHLALLLALYARLAELEGEAADDVRRARWRSARRALLWEHLLSWLPAYVAKLSELAAPPYRAWGATLLEALAAEARELGSLEQLPLHLREAPPVADPRASSADEFLRTLLAPVRSGVILTRTDLARAGGETGLAPRAGERRFVLRTLVGQDSEHVLGWLVAEAAAWAAAHGKHAGTFGEVARWWERRAEATAVLLDDLRREAIDFRAGLQ